MGNPFSGRLLWVIPSLADCYGINDYYIYMCVCMRVCVVVM